MPLLLIGVEMAYMLETAARATGASVKQLIHWDATGLIRPSVAQARGKGSRRIYSFLDVLAIKTAVMLRRQGISLQKIRRCLKYIREHQPKIETPLSTLNLVTDGVSLFLLTHDPRQACEDKKVVDTLAGGQLLLMVPIGHIACTAQRDVARLESQNTKNEIRHPKQVQKMKSKTDREARSAF